MRKTLLLAVLVSPSLAAAAELELAGYGGYTFPLYSQTFKYDPGPVTVPIPGVSVEQGGGFELTGSGAIAFAWFARTNSAFTPVGQLQQS